MRNMRLETVEFTDLTVMPGSRDQRRVVQGADFEIWLEGGLVYVSKNGHLAAYPLGSVRRMVPLDEVKESIIEACEFAMKYGAEPEEILVADDEEE